MKGLIESIKEREGRTFEEGSQVINQYISVKFNMTWQVMELGRQIGIERGREKLGPVVSDGGTADNGSG